MTPISRETEIEDELNAEAAAIDAEISGETYDPTSTDHTIICGDYHSDAFMQKAEELGIARNVDLIVTSPPYNAGIKYDVHDDNMPLEDYCSFLGKFAEVSDKMLKDGGRVVVNIRDIKTGVGKRYPIIVTLFDEFCTKRGYSYRGAHIWYKGREESSTAWGSWRSCANPSIIDLFEYIYVFQKGEFQKDPGVKYSSGKEEFIESVIGMWKIRPVKKMYSKSGEVINVASHPCPYPVELIERVLTLYSYSDALVLDPYGGIGSTSMAACMCGRNSVSVDISPDYSDVAFDNVSKTGCRVKYVKIDEEMYKRILDICTKCEDRESCVHILCEDTCPTVIRLLEDKHGEGNRS